LAEEIRERVRREQGIELEYEVELWRANQPANSMSGEGANEEREADAEAKEQKP
jgi:hypothetical protein